MKIIYKIWLIVAMFALCACGSDETISGSEEPVKELKEYTVSLKLSGEITTSDSPLARAETDSKDLYGVQVYRQETGKTSYSYFAYGLFDNVSDMKINLLEGAMYKFRILYIKDGKSLVGQESQPQGSGYGSPFKHSGYNHNSMLISIPTACNNTYILFDSFYDELEKGLYYSEGNCYYGELSDYTPTVNGTVDIDLKHTVFGLQYEVKGITDGTVSVEIKNNSRTFFSESNITEDYTSEEKIIAFYDAYNAWLYSDNYTENLTVSLSWTRGIGVLQNLGSKIIQVKRNVMNVVRIQLGANDGSASFGITTEDDTNMGVGEVTIPLG